MNHPSMTGRGRMIAALLGIVFALALPKHTDCDEYGAHGAYDCTVINQYRERCKPYAVEPFGAYLFGAYVLHRQVGIAYSRGSDCH